MRIIRSAAVRHGWGSARYRWVSGLTKEEKEAVKNGDLVYFRITPWHYKQSGIKVIARRPYERTCYWDCREPSEEERKAIERWERRLRGTDKHIAYLGSLLGQFEEWRLSNRRRNNHAPSLLQNSKEQ